MRNLINFLLKYSFFFVFALLEIIAFSLLISNNSYQRTAYLSASNGFTAGIHSKISLFTDYIGLKEENKTLASENAFLRSQLKESNLWKQDSFIQYADTQKTQFYSYIQSQIISNSFQSRNNYLILNKGTADGVETEMGVISSNGVVGIINSVSEHFSTVISILHSKSAVDAKITSNEYTGTCFWPGMDYQLGELKNIPSHVKLQNGDTVVTSGNSSIFPPEIPIGYIKDFSIKAGNNFYKINLNYSVDYNKLNHVYIIHNFLKEELNTIKEVRNER